MARDHARIRLDIWSDDDFRNLTSNAQWLYFHLLTSPELSFAGIVDWRPARIAAHTTELTADDVEHFAVELEDGTYLVIDRHSEEALIRSFVKHDGLMKSPNMAKALAKDHAVIGSAVLRAVVVGQLKRLKANEPDLKGWASIGTLLGKRSMTPARAAKVLPRNPSVNPSTNPSINPSSGEGRNPSRNPSVTPFLPNSPPPRLHSSSSPTYREGGQ